MNDRILDTLVASETPEGITIELRPAGLCARCYAYLIDQLIRIGILYACAIATALMGGLGVGLWLILAFGLEWFYPVAFELSRSGATPGKRVFGMRVVMDNGLPVTPAASVIRNLLRFADFLPALYGFGIVSSLARSDFKRLGDITAGTLVVYEPPVAPKVGFDEIAPRAPVVPLRPREQAAVVALAARAPRLTPERLDELAALAGWVSGDGDKSGRDVTQRVLAVAQWLLGKR